MPRLIDADALADELAVLLERNTKLINEWLANLIEDAVDDAPTVDAEPVRHGHWIWMGERGDSRYMCSVCKSKEDVPTCNGEPTIWEYCPNCGAKMQGDNDGNK